MVVESTLGQLPHLDTFSKAAELSSFTAAAKVLGLTQAAVSQRVQALENALNTPLFKRQSGRVLLTEAGRKLYDYAQEILDLHLQAQREITGRVTPVAGELFLAASSIPGECLLPGLLSIFRRKYPHLRVHATVGDSMDVITQVERGEVSLDCGTFGYWPRGQSLFAATVQGFVAVPGGPQIARRWNGRWK
jgi:DNA-binding transcriptional LysR family regulator